jgi:hypothetical protein
MVKMPKTRKVKNFIGRGVDDGSSGLTPKEHPGMGMYYGTSHKNPIGKLRSNTVGYAPVTKKKLGKPPKNVV